MAGARRRDVNVRTVSDVKLLPMSDKRPLEEPMISPHSQQLLVAPMDQVPSSDKAIWLYEASQAPDNIARILKRSELELLLRVLNRELVETQIFVEAALRAPRITKRTLRAEWDEYRASSRHLRKVLGGGSLVLAVLAIVGVAADVAILTGIACGLMVEVGILHYAHGYDKSPTTECCTVWFPPVLGIPLVFSEPSLPWLRHFMISAGILLVAWFPLLLVIMSSVKNKLHPDALEWSSRLGKQVLDENPAATLDPALLQEGSSTNCSPGKYFRPEWRIPILFAISATRGRRSTAIAERARARVLHAVDYVMHRAMTIHPELLWSVEEFTCKVSVAAGPPIELQLPVVRVSDSGGPPHMDDLHPKRSVTTPFSAFVHHASQPDAETGETLVNVDMMHARRRAFLKLHGMDGGAVPTDRALPPMGEAVEEMAREHRQSLSSAVAHRREQPETVPGSGVGPGGSLWEGGGGYGGAMGQYNPLVGGTAEEETAKKMVAGDGSGTAGPHVV